METTNIYILIDPISNAVRYVGKANNISQRYKAHLNRARNHQLHKKRWIQCLKQKGLKPIIEVIDIVPIQEWVFWESYWIGQFKAWGFNLINYTFGGDGSTFGNNTSFKKGNKAWNDTDTFMDCLQCRNKFKKSPSRFNKNYCSMICYAKSKEGKPNNSNTTFKEGHIPWNKGTNITLKPSKPVYQYNKHTKEFIRKWDSVEIAAKTLNGNVKAIRHCCTGNSKSSIGYWWSYNLLTIK